jgi:hypothetical protein
VSLFEPEEATQQLREPAIVVVASRAIAVSPYPFRMLREKRIVHLALQFHIRRGFNRKSGKRWRIHI